MARHAEARIVGCGLSSACPWSPIHAPAAYAPGIRARRLYPDVEAVVDGERRPTYEQFFARCDRWSAAFEALGSARAAVWPASRPTRLTNSYRSTPCRSSVPCWCRSTTASPPTTSPTSSTIVARASSWRRRTTWTPWRACGRSCRAWRTSPPWRAHDGWEAYETLLDGAAATFTRPHVDEADCSPSTTPAGRPRAPRA